jgi:hypothetical protein
MKKSKSPDTRLEDRIWCLFFQMGYPVLSGEKFLIQYKQSDGADGSKRINVFPQSVGDLVLTLITASSSARDTS